MNLGISIRKGVLGVLYVPFSISYFCFCNSATTYRALAIKSLRWKMKVKEKKTYESKNIKKKNLYLAYFSEY